MGAFVCVGCDLSQPFFNLTEANSYAAAHTEFHEWLEWLESLNYELSLDK
jgi:hypothetical protein